MRNLSQETLNAIFAQQTDKAFYILLTIIPDERERRENLYVYNANETENGEPRKIMHKGNEFIAYPFEINLPPEGSEVSGTIKLTIANVDRIIVETIRSIRYPMKARLEVVMSSDLETTEAGPWEMKLTNVTGDALTIEGDLIVDRFMDEPFPKNKMDASIFPAMF